MHAWGMLTPVFPCPLFSPSQHISQPGPKTSNGQMWGTNRAEEHWARPAASSRPSLASGVQPQMPPACQKMLLGFCLHVIMTGARARSVSDQNCSGSTNSHSSPFPRQAPLHQRVPKFTPSLSASTAGLHCSTASGLFRQLPALATQAHGAVGGGLPWGPRHCTQTLICTHMCCTQTHAHAGQTHAHRLHTDRTRVSVSGGRLT